MAIPAASHAEGSTRSHSQVPGTQAPVARRTREALALAIGYNAGEIITGTLARFARPAVLGAR